ncbi:hypothetical protein [Thermosulfurimonas sp. F29]|uniref:hypothetical protein n=1 Tax=Thermosulfurimonas sp. F29 TaxID=2867247 RepID=UPI001C833C1D|nr:hypothetical protein [Thermosulfurimonas sp. F29]MBX6422125.1 hypothetical protein [Thermosulfurimonas sp. F29]
MREVYRKLLHLSGLILHPLVLWLGARSVLLWGPLLVGVTAFEILRLCGRGWFPPGLGKLLRPEEKRRPTGTFYYLWGVGLAFLLFPVRAALAGLWVLALADALAGLSGRGLRHHLVFFLTALLVALGWGHPPSLPLILKVLLWTLIEALPGLNDNLTLPLAVAVTWSR